MRIMKAEPGIGRKGLKVTEEYDAKNEEHRRIADENMSDERRAASREAADAHLAALEKDEPEPEKEWTSRSGYSIDDKVFNLNQFVEGGETHQLRLDELNSLRERQVRGDKILVGDASAREVIEWLVKRAGVLGHRLFGPLVPVLAKCLLAHMEEVANGNPLAYVNPNWDHAARDLTRFGYIEDDMRGSGVPNGYPKPTAMEAAETRRQQERVAQQSYGVEPAEERHSDQAKSVGSEEGHVVSKPQAPVEDEELRRLLGRSEE